MDPARLFLPALLVFVGITTPALCEPPHHALELDPEGAVLFVDLPRARLLSFVGGELRVLSDLDGVPVGHGLHNLVRTLSGDLYLGEKKEVWRIDRDGSARPANPPPELKSLFSRRPAALAPDGSIYRAHDFTHLERSLPGGDAHPVPSDKRFRQIETLRVTPFGKVYVADYSAVFRLDADGSRQLVYETDGREVLGLGDLSDGGLLVLLVGSQGRELTLLRVDASGRVEELLSPAEIAAAPLAVASADPMPEGSTRD